MPTCSERAVRHALKAEEMFSRVMYRQILCAHTKLHGAMFGDDDLHAATRNVEGSCATSCASISMSTASRNAESANNWIERSSSMRKLNQFMKFDWEAFAKGKRFLCVGGGKWVD